MERLVYVPDKMQDELEGDDFLRERRGVIARLIFELVDFTNYAILRGPFACRGYDAVGTTGLRQIRIRQL